MIEIVQKVWGYEKIILNEPEYCFKELYLDAMKYCSYHYHKVKKETFIIKSGVVLLIVSGEKMILSAGMMVTIDRNTKHKFIGITDAVIMEISSRDDPVDSYRDNVSGVLSNVDYLSLCFEVYAQSPTAEEKASLKWRN